MSLPLPELRKPSVHRTPHARLVDRVDALRDLVRDRRIIDIGFADEGMMVAKRAHRAWLHEILAEAARECVGIDADADAVMRAQELGFTAHVANVEDEAALRALGLEPADVVVAGELIEHLDRPGAFVDAVGTLLAPGGALILTTPNAHSLTNVLGALAGRELVNPDHVGWYSWRTLMTLLARHGWRLDQLSYYPFPRVQSGSVAPRLLFNAYQGAVRPLFRVRPALADGIVAVARRS
jgi:2-polyprenyl-3-methyl-5-hydroxy-6-metoxy-1,4-benzoquinol methylase